MAAVGGVIDGIILLLEGTCELCFWDASPGTIPLLSGVCGG